MKVMLIYMLNMQLCTMQLNHEYIQEIIKFEEVQREKLNRSEEIERFQKEIYLKEDLKVREILKIDELVRCYYEIPSLSNVNRLKEIGDYAFQLYYEDKITKEAYDFIFKRRKEQSEEISKTYAFIKEVFAETHQTLAETRESCAHNNRMMEDAIMERKARIKREKEKSIGWFIIGTAVAVGAAITASYIYVVNKCCDIASLCYPINLDVNVNENIEHEISDVNETNVSSI